MEHNLAIISKQNKTNVTDNKISNQITILFQYKQRNKINSNKYKSKNIIFLKKCINNCTYQFIINYPTQLTTKGKKKKEKRKNQ